MTVPLSVKAFTFKEHIGSDNNTYPIYIKYCIYITFLHKRKRTIKIHICIFFSIDGNHLPLTHFKACLIFPTKRKRKRKPHPPQLRTRSRKQQPADYLRRSYGPVRLAHRLSSSPEYDICQTAHEKWIPVGVRHIFCSVTLLGTGVSPDSWLNQLKKYY